MNTPTETRPCFDSSNIPYIFPKVLKVTPEVSFVYRDDPTYYIDLETGEHISASSNHAMQSLRGPVLAKDVLVGDRIRIPVVKS